MGCQRGREDMVGLEVWGCFGVCLDTERREGSWMAFCVACLFGSCLFIG